MSTLRGCALTVESAPSIRFRRFSRAPVLSERQIYYQQLRVRIHQQLVERLNVQNLRNLPPDTVRAEVRVLQEG